MNKQMIKALAALVMAAAVLAVGLYARVDAFGGKGFDSSSSVSGHSVAVKESKPVAVNKTESKTASKTQESSRANTIDAGKKNSSNLDSTKRKSTIPDSTKLDSTKSLAEILREKGITGQIPNLKIVVDKSAHVLTLYSGVTPLKQYHVAIGEGGLADKEKAGDKRTPEGKFYIGERSVLSPVDQYLGSRWMRVSYPNIEDAERGLKAGIIDQLTRDQIVEAVNNGQVPPQRTALGGGVGIHGGSGQGENQGDYWTWGCIGLKNSDIEDFFDYIATGTELIINA